MSFEVTIMWVYKLKERDKIYSIIENELNNININEWESFLLEVDLQHEEDDEKKSRIYSLLDSLNSVLSTQSRYVDYLNFDNYTLFIGGSSSYSEDDVDTLYYSQFVPERIKILLGIEDGLDSYIFFIERYKKQLPDNLLKELNAWNIARKI